MVDNVLTYDDCKIVMSAAVIVIGDVVTLRPEQGGGRWKVVEMMPKVGPFHRAVVQRSREEP